MNHIRNFTARLELVNKRLAEPLLWVIIATIIVGFLTGHLVIV